MKARKRNLPLGLVIVIDLFFVGVGLVVFALFHHVIPRDFKSSGLALPASAVTVQTSLETTSAVRISPAATNIIAGTSESDSDVADTASEVGTWRAKFAGKFTDGPVEQTATTYRSSNINIAINKVSANGTTYFVADIYLSDISYFKTAFAKGIYGHGLSDEALDIANENNAILGISGDYYGIRDVGVVIRNGQLYREGSLDDVLVMNNDGSMQTFTREQFDIEQVKANGAWQAWSFGPMLLDGGQPMSSFNSRLNPQNPRAAIGCFEPGHYCFVVVDGRQPGYSDGMTLTELSRIFDDLGCTTAYNLDGGKSALMTFQGKIVNQPYQGGRKVSDIVYIGE